MQSAEKIRKILVAVDGSDKSLEAADNALSIASIIEQVELIILNVLDTQPWYHGKSAYGWATEYIRNEIQQRQKVLDKIKEKAEKFNIHPKTEILMSPQTTNTAAAIVNYAEKEEVNLIVIGTRGRTGITRVLLGSVASGVVTYSHCPVLVVK